VETYIHEALRAKNLSEFAPPELSAERVGDDRVSITYASDRELCDLAKGLVRGIGAYYDEPLAVNEPACMHDGDPHCELVVTRA
jgi:predicted hydrocarbon binding protein